MKQVHFNEVHIKVAFAKTAFYHTDTRKKKTIYSFPIWWFSIGCWPYCCASIAICRWLSTNKLSRSLSTNRVSQRSRESNIENAAIDFIQVCRQSRNELEIIGQRAFGRKQFACYARFIQFIQFISFQFSKSFRNVSLFASSPFQISFCGHEWKKRHQLTQFHLINSFESVRVGLRFSLIWRLCNYVSKNNNDIWKKKTNQTACSRWSCDTI